MKFEKVYADIVNSFGSLWKYKERENSLEVITPFATTNNRFVSVFISKRDDVFIISDGGWIDNAEYETPFMLDDNCFNKIHFHYLNTFNIKEIKSANNKTIFYKVASKQTQIPSMVFDMANFISSVVSMSDIEFADQVEIESKERFRKIANSYMSEVVVKENLNLKGYLDENKEIRVNAIVERKNKLTLVNYITGVNTFYFSNSIYKSYYHFELANGSKFHSHIKEKVALIDDTASGYVPPKIASTINHLAENTKTTPVIWSEREKLKKILELS